MPSAQPLPAIDPEYAVEQMIGQGERDTVYRAVDRHGRQVAIKLYDHRMERDPVFVASFRREARAMCTLRHPHVRRTLSYGYEDGQYYLVNEYVDEGDLSRWLGQGDEPIPPAAFQAVLDACSGLDYLHQRGIVHRAVKPGNILLRSTGEAVIADLGPPYQPGTSDLTLTLEITTSLAYMSPEQLLNLPLTPASDVYSMGVVLYQLSTGHLPWDAPNPMAAAIEKLEAEPRPLNASHPSGELAQVVMRCLERDPLRRYRTAGELAEALRRAARDAAQVTVASNLLGRTGQLAMGGSRSRGGWARGRAALSLRVLHLWPSLRRAFLQARTERGPQVRVQR